MLENFHERASNDPGEPQLWCYTDRWSAAPGDAVGLHVSTTLDAYDLEIWRDGALREDVLTVRGLAGRFHPTPEDCSVSGCRWPKALDIEIPNAGGTSGWRSGGYVIRVSGRTADGRLLEHHHLIIVRATPGHEGRLLLVAATGTWLAYNDWGGSNHYEGITGPDRNRFSPRVSMLRPFSRGFVVLPDGAPRVPLRTPPVMGAALRHPHMEWAYANGYSKKYTSAGWASYDRHFARWAEAAGYDIDVCALHDLGADPGILSRYRLAVFVGHDEYWSKEMRDAVDAFIEAGGRAARFAGNFLWQTRIEDGGTTQVCYKYRAREEDPLYRDPATRTLTTTAWEAIEVGRPGALTFGVNALRGIYVGWGGAAPRHAGGFTVYRSSHWSLEGTDLYYGDVFGGASRIFGYEVDGLSYGVRNGLPYATGEDGAPEGIEIVAMGVAVCAEENHGYRGVDHFLGEEDLEFAASAVHGNATPETMDLMRYGSGMMVSMRKGRGEVFTAGTCEWVAGLIDRDPFVERITRNVLDRFLVPTD
ncbi:MAG: hypothetical protein GC150_01110 [Rhizobiales bacterium]|nr:hypothetical protein [Hyphomicrobiales bacterium]